MTGTVRWLVAAGMVAVVVLAGCDDANVPPFAPEKGVYQGKPYEPLDDEILRALRDRAASQGGLDAPSVPGSGGVGGSVRPPEGGG